MKTKALSAVFALVLLPVSEVNAQIAVGTAAPTTGEGQFPAQAIVMPAGSPGLVQTRESDSAFVRIELGPVMAFSPGSFTSPRDGFTTTWRRDDAWTYEGEMNMESGTTYRFASFVDGYVTLFIDGTRIRAQEPTHFRRNSFFVSSYKCTTSGWHPIKVEVRDAGGTFDISSSWPLGIAFNTSGQTSSTPVDGWTRLVDPGDGSLLRTAAATTNILTGVQVVAAVRKTDPTILDAKYIVYGADGETAKVRSLAFEDGERSFRKVVRPETFVKDPEGKPTSQNVGDAIPVNTELNLSWGVSLDWNTDLSMAMFEILAVKDIPLPFDLVEIPDADARHPGLVITTNVQTDEDVFNALLWHYSCADEDLFLADGYLRINGSEVANRTSLTGKFAALEWLYAKTGFRILEGASFAYAKSSSRLALEISSHSPYACEVATAPDSIFVGENAYCSIDLSGGPSAESYPVTYLDSVPAAGWSDDYKTTNLLLRLIPPGTYQRKVNGVYCSVTLTKPFYMGVFEVTQRQWELVMGSNPSSLKGDKRPVESVSWNAIRGNSGIYNWPTIADVDPDSFAGRISARTGLGFDLPTRAQWEYACRAGTTTDPDYRLFARTAGNRTDGRGGYSDGHTAAGSYCANDWGLYDMCGNVWEWTLDWFALLNTDAVTDPKGAVSGSSRVVCGGGYNYGPIASPDLTDQRGPSSDGYGMVGFRLSRTLP